MWPSSQLEYLASIPDPSRLLSRVAVRLSTLIRAHTMAALQLDLVDPWAIMITGIVWKR